MNGGVQYEYLVERMDVGDFMRLKSKVMRLNNKQKSELKKK